jgi:VIT1/CCC1 family predicted Fe2+/Mn2+ transporter
MTRSVHHLHRNWPGLARPMGPHAHHPNHRDVTGGWLRPTVFGLMDGLVSNFALVAGIAGADVTAHYVAVGGLAGLVGGAFSMATGEYISVKSQNEAAQAELAVERSEILDNSAGEEQELAELYVARGVEPNLAAEVARQLSRDPEQALVIHAREELGIDPHSLPSPWVAALSSLLSFAIGALMPLLPYLLSVRALWLSAVLALTSLFVAGAVSARYTGRSWLFAGSRQLVLGVLSALVAYGVGHVFGQAVG